MNRINYLVEGETEKKFIITIKEEYIFSGKVTLFNLWEKDISNLLITINADIIVIIFDNDVYSVNHQRFKCFKNNIKKLSERTKVKKIVLLGQNKNLEDEIVSATNLQKIENFYNISADKHKTKFIKDKKLLLNLQKWNFKFNNIWISEIMIDSIVDKKVIHNKLKISKKGNGEI